MFSAESGEPDWPDRSGYNHYFGNGVYPGVAKDGTVLDLFQKNIFTVVLIPRRGIPNHPILDLVPKGSGADVVRPFMIVMNEHR
jgi:hypothetical protein